MLRISHDPLVNFLFSAAADPEGMSAVFVEHPSGRFERKWKVREAIDSDDVGVEYTDGFLTLRFKPRQVDGPLAIEAKSSELSRHYARKLKIPPSGDLAEIDATLEQGLLRIEVRKRAELRPRKISLAAS